MSNDYCSRRSEIAERVAFIQRETRMLMSDEIHAGLVRKLTSALAMFQTYEQQVRKTPNDSSYEAIQRVIRLLDESLNEARRLADDLRRPVSEGDVTSLGEEYSPYDNEGANNAC